LLARITRKIIEKQILTAFIGILPEGRMRNSRLYRKSTGKYSNAGERRALAATALQLLRVAISSAAHEKSWDLGQT
jgi:hypothetical protein